MLEANATLQPFEIKKSAPPSKDAVRHFSALARTGREVGPGGVICVTDSVCPLDKNNCGIPV
jgi:hypothetical protein